MGVRRFVLRASCVLAILLLSVVAGGAAQADTANFNFEGQPATFTSPPQGVRPGALTSLTMTVSGLTVVITRPGSRFDVVDNTAANQGGKPAAFGARSLDPFFDINNTPFVANFSQDVSGISIDMGDYGGSELDTITLEAFSGLDGTGTLLGSTTTTCCGGEAFAFATLSVTVPGIRSIRFIGGSAGFPNSVFYDNLVATFAPAVATPEPATIALFGTGLIGFAAKRRRRKALERQAS
jgi:hypothetical protein